MTESMQADTARPGKWRWLFWAFAVLGVLAAIAIIWLAVALGTEFRSREPAEIAAQDSGEVLEVESVNPLEGTDLIAITIEGRETERGLGSIKSGYIDRRNVLLLNRKTGETRRILPDNKTRIAEIDWFPARGEGTPATADSAAYVAAQAAGAGQRKAPPAFYALQLKRAVNGVTTLDLMVGSLATGRQGVVLEGISGIEQSWMIDEQQLGLLVREDKALYFRVIDIPALKLIQSRKIEIG